MDKKQKQIINARKHENLVGRRDTKKELLRRKEKTTAKK